MYIEKKMGVLLLPFLVFFCFLVPEEIQGAPKGSKAKSGAGAGAGAGTGAAQSNNKNDGENEYSKFSRSIIPVTGHLGEISVQGLVPKDKGPMSRGVESGPKVSHSKGISPFYHAGYDKKDRPLWIFDMEALTLATFVAKNKLGNLLVWQNKIKDLMDKSVTERQEDGFPNVTGFANIYDMGGNYLHLLSSPNLMVSFKVIIENFFEDDILNKMEQAFHINLAPMTLLILESLGAHKPPNAKTTKYFGTERKLWEAALLEAIPKDQLPPELGGDSNFVPVSVYPIQF